MGFSLPEYCGMLDVWSILGKHHFSNRNTTYTGSHLLSSSIMTIIIALGEDVVFIWLEASTMIVPGSSLVRRPDCIYARPEIGIAGDQVIRRNSRDRSWKALVYTSY